MEQDKLAGDGAFETRIGTKTTKTWTKYFEELDRRLERGAKIYGDESFDKSQKQLLGEIQEEILDIAGWSFILWEKLERMKVK